VLSDWLQRPATVAFAVWEGDDPQTPRGLAWATRRPEDAVRRFVGVRDDARRRGTGQALLGALLTGLGRPRGGAPGGAGGALPLQRPLRAALHDPGAEQEFFRRLGFEAEQVTHRLGRELGGGAPPGPRQAAGRHARGHGAAARRPHLPKTAPAG
jgi:GNAT superfamily N-acetyltransferase